jgi:hypothetical protein
MMGDLLPHAVLSRCSVELTHLAHLIIAWGSTMDCHVCERLALHGLRADFVDVQTFTWHPASYVLETGHCDLDCAHMP